MGSICARSWNRAFSQPNPLSRDHSVGWRQLPACFLMLMESLTRSYRKEEKIDGGRGEAGTMAQERWPNSNGFLDYRLIIDRDPVVRPKVRIWKAFSEKGDRLSSYFGVCVRVCVCVCVCRRCQEVADRTDVTTVSAAVCCELVCLSPFYHLPPARCLEWF